MSRPHDGQRASFPFGNPFRNMLPGRSYLSPKLQVLLTSFEKTLAERLKKLNPKEKTEVLSLSWMRMAIKSLCETHSDIKNLLSNLQFPASDWDEKWIDAYLDDSVKLLDICIAFSSEISRHGQGQLLLQYAIHVLDFSSDFPSSDKLSRAHASLQDWMQQIGSKTLSTTAARNPKLECCSTVLRGFAESLYPMKMKTSAKGKVLMRAMYGFKAETLFVCSVFTAALSGSPKPLMDINIPQKFLWSASFMNLQTDINAEIRRLFSVGAITIIKDLYNVGACVENLDSKIENKTLPQIENKTLPDVTVSHGEAEIPHRPVTELSQNEKLAQVENLDSKIENKTLPDVTVSHGEAEILQRSVTELRENSEKLAQGLDLLSKDVNGFFQILLSGRDALLCDLRVTDVPINSNGEEQVDSGLMHS